MSKLIISRKQYYDEKFIYWYNKVHEAFADYLHNPSEKPVVYVVKYKNDFIVDLSEISELKDIPGSCLAFRLPEDWRTKPIAFTIAWLTQKLMNWQRQVK